MPPRLVALFALLACATTAHATTIYRCTDAKGAVTMQNDVPCGPGMTQEVRTIGELPTAPAPVRREAPEPVANIPPPGARFELVRGPVNDALPESTLAKEDRKPPPALYECKTFDADIYLSESGEPESRCVMLNTVGLNGDANFGAGAACEMQRDTCAALDGEALCKAWSRRVDEARFRMTYANADDKPSRTAEYERQRDAFVDSSCR